MHRADLLDQNLAKKRALQGEENSGELKRQKMEKKKNEDMPMEDSSQSKKRETEHETNGEMIIDSNQLYCDHHLKEIERLRQELKEKDAQISIQAKKISELKKKVKKTKKDKK